MNVHYDRATILYEQDNFSEALKLYELGLADEPDSARITCMIACCHNAMGHVTEALSWSKKAVSLDPESSLAFHVLGRALYAEKGFIGGEVMDAFKTSIRCDPASTQNYSYLAGTYAAHKEFKVALGWAEQALNFNPQHARCLAIVGWCRFHLGQIDAAEKLLKDSLQIEPNAAATHRYLAHLYIIKGNLPLAREHITVAHQIDPRGTVVATRSFQTAYANTSHDLMCEIVKADGTLYGNVLILMARLNHASLVHEAKLGAAYPVLLVVGLILLGAIGMLAKTLLERANYNLSNTITIVLLCAFFVCVLVPAVLWWVSTRKMMLTSSTRKYLTERQKTALILLPIQVIVVGGFVGWSAVENDRTEADLRDTMKQARQLEQKGDFGVAATKLREAIWKYLKAPAAMSSYRIQNAAFQSGLPIDSPEKKRIDYKTDSNVWTAIVESSYNELKSRAAAAIEKDPQLKKRIDDDYDACMTEAKQK